MVIMGVDPGSRITGFGVLKGTFESYQHLSHGVIKLPEAAPFGERLAELGRNFDQILDSYQPQIVVLERVFLGKNPDSAFKLGHARGVLWYLARARGIQVFEYSTRSVKRSVTGSGGAAKDEVQRTLQRLLRLAVLAPLDASDALALAFHHLEVARRESLTLRMDRHPKKEKNQEL